MSRSSDEIDQRYYASGYGRFNTADSFSGSAAGRDPNSWNRYAYSLGDPINNDPSGLCTYTTYSSDGKGNFTVTCIDLDFSGGGGTGTKPPPGPQRNDPTDPAGIFGELSPQCQKGLTDALKVKSGTNPEIAAQLRLAALQRANNNISLLQQAAAGSGLGSDWELLAAIGIRETGFQNIAQPNGKGAGVFQIDLGQNPSVTSAQAFNVSFAANWAANYLASNMAILAAAHPNLTGDALLQATAASYNFGTGNISGNPNTIDVGTTGNNYGSNVLNLIQCFN